MQQDGWKNGAECISCLVYIFSFLGLERNAAIALIHYDQHWFALSSSNQVIKNKVHLTLHRPACLVFAHTMLQVKHRITFLFRSLVFCWCIDMTPTILFLHGRIIDHRTNLSMRHLLWTVVVPFRPFGYFDGTGASIAATIRISLYVCHRHAIYHIVIKMKPNDQRRSGDIPPSVVILCHVISFSAYQVYLLRLGSIEAEVTSLLFVNTRIFSLKKGRFRNHCIFRYRPLCIHAGSNQQSCQKRP